MNLLELDVYTVLLTLHHPTIFLVSLYIIIMIHTSITQCTYMYVPSYAHTHMHTHTSLISLLEYAEETLQCKSAYLFFDRTTPEPERKRIVRDTCYLGFELLAPSHPNLPLISQDYLFLGYDLDCGGESDSDADAD